MAEPLTSPIRYAIYTRQSVARAMDFSSCEAQFTSCQSHLATEPDQARLVWVGERFDDEGYSGATLDRPALQRLRALVQHRGIDRLYVRALDRLSRRLQDSLQLLEECQQAGVQVSITSAPDLGSPAQVRLVHSILATFAQFEREMIASRIAETRAYLKTKGQRLAGLVPLGYTADRTTKQLQVHPDEAAQVRTIFRLAAEGAKPSAIAPQLNAWGWRAKVYRAQRSGRTSGGGPWTPRQVLRVLSNPVYTGRFRDGATIRAGTHDPIVPLELFEQVQTRIAGRRTTQTPRQPGRDLFLLRGKVLCPSCQRPLSTYYVAGRKRGLARTRYLYYRCRSAAGGRPPCPGVQVAAGRIHEAVQQSLLKAATWEQLGRSQPELAAEAPALGETWRALDVMTRQRLLPRIIEHVGVDLECSVIRITYAASFWTSVKSAAGR